MSIPNPFVAVSAVVNAVRSPLSCESRERRLESLSTVPAMGAVRGCVAVTSQVNWLSPVACRPRCRAGLSLVRGSATMPVVMTRRSEHSSARSSMVMNTRMRIDSCIREAKTTVKG